MGNIVIFPASLSHDVRYQKVPVAVEDGIEEIFPGAFPVTRSVVNHMRIGSKIQNQKYVAIKPQKYVLFHPDLQVLFQLEITKEDQATLLHLTTCVWCPIDRSNFTTCLLLQSIVVAYCTRLVISDVELYATCF